MPGGRLVAALEDLAVHVAVNELGLTSPDPSNGRAVVSTAGKIDPWHATANESPRLGPGRALTCCCLLVALDLRLEQLNDLIGIRVRYSATASVDQGRTDQGEELKQRVAI